MNLCPASMNPFKGSPDISIYEWAEESRILTSSTSNITGKWSTERTPYLKRIMEVLSPQHPCKRVVLRKCTQSGGTEVAVNMIGHRRVHSPTSILVVLPTDPSAVSWSKSRITALFETTFADEKARGSDTIWHKDFPGGSIKVASAGSPASLKSNPIEIAIIDEADEFPLTVGSQGCPIALVDARQSTYPNRKMYVVSSPTDEETSRINREFLAGNRQYFHVPCPSCDFEQTIDWQDIQYVDDDPSTARWCCRGCGVLHDESVKKTWTTENTFWVAENPASEIESFHLSAFFVPWVRWSEIVDLWLRAQKDPKLLPLFTNTIRGLPTKSQGIEAPSWTTLYDRRESYPIATVPDGPQIMTAGVDVQGDRLEMEVIGWRHGLENWSIDYQVIPGDPYDIRTWDTLAERLAITYPTHDGGQMGIACAAVDTGFATTEVQKFLRRYQGLQTVIGIKGQDSNTFKDVIKFQKTEPGLSIYNIGTGVLKSQTYGFLALDYEIDDEGVVTYPNGYCHFPEYSVEYFEMLTAESQKLVRNRQGYMTRQWVKDRDRNEALDTRIYARAALETLGIARWQPHHWEAQREKSKPILDRQTRQEQRASNPSKTRRPKINPQDDFW